MPVKLLSSGPKKQSRRGREIGWTPLDQDNLKGGRRGGRKGGGGNVETTHEAGGLRSGGRWRGA